LRIDGNPVSSSKELFLVYRLLCCKIPSKTILNSGIIGIALDIAVRYFNQIEQIGRGVEEGSTLTNLVITRAPPAIIMP
jgi:hypothetical protein